MEPPRRRAAGRACGALLLLAGLHCWSRAFVPQAAPAARKRGPRVKCAAGFDLGGFVGSVFGGGDDATENEDFSVPQDVSECVTGLKESTENILNLEISRLDVELPPAYELGVEGDKVQGRLLSDTIFGDGPKEAARGDRELARIFQEMMQPVADGLVLAFRTKDLAKKAKMFGGTKKEEGRIIALPEKTKTAFAEEVGGPAVFKDKLEEMGCKCLIVVSPDLYQLRLINELSDAVGDQMGIFLLNARIWGKNAKLPRELIRSLRKKFPSTYHARFLPYRKNGLVFRKLGRSGNGPWILAQQRELVGGRPSTSEVARWDKPPSKSKIEEAFAAWDARDKDLGDQFLSLVDKDERRDRALKEKDGS